MLGLTFAFCLSQCLQETEKIIAELNETWEEKLRKTEALRMERYEGPEGRLIPLQGKIMGGMIRLTFAFPLLTEKHCWPRWAWLSGRMAVLWVSSLQKRCVRGWAEWPRELSGCLKKGLDVV